MDDLIELAKKHPELIAGDQELFYEIVHEHILALTEFAYQHATKKNKMRHMLMGIFYKATSPKRDLDNEDRI
jgi:hypothetical protein